MALITSMFSSVLYQLAVRVVADTELSIRITVKSFQYGTKFRIVGYAVSDEI
jgi:hypothetical protein